MSAASVGSSASSTAGPPAAARPVAVVWGSGLRGPSGAHLSSLPEEFPDRDRIVRAVEAVGRMAVAAAVGQELWDPDPSSAIAFYPNLFLHPAAGGAFTCIGRLFLAKQEPRRLGFKSFVLDTRELLDTGRFGPTVLRWHASMGGAATPSAEPAAPRDGRLAAAVASGMVMGGGTTEPMVLLAESSYEPAMRLLLEMIGEMPTALLAASSILTFPFPLPERSRRLAELQSEVPLALVLVRDGIGRSPTNASESADRFPLLDLDGLAAEAEGGGPSPAFARLLVDGDAPRLAAIRTRTDQAELPRLRIALADPSQQTAEARRSEIWRVGTQMESAAMLFKRAVGRSPPSPTSPAVPPTPARPVASAPLAPARSGASAGPMPSSLQSPLVPRPLPKAADRPAARPSSPTPMGARPPTSSSSPAPVPTPAANDAGSRPSPYPSAPSDERPGSEARLHRSLDARIAEEHQVTVAAIQSLREEFQHRVDAEAAMARGALLASAPSEVDRRVRESVRSSLHDQVQELADTLRVELEERFARENQSAGAAREAVESSSRALENRLEERWSALLQARAADIAASLQTQIEATEARSAERAVQALDTLRQELRQVGADREVALDDRIAKATSKLEGRLDKRLAEHLGEALESERARSVELLARMQLEIQEAAKTADPGALEGLVAGQLAVLRGSLAEETRTTAEASARELERRLEAVRRSDVERLARLESQIGAQSEALAAAQRATRAELDETVKKVLASADRLVPVVKKTWERLQQLEAAAPGGSGLEAARAELRAEFTQEVARLDADLKSGLEAIRRDLEGAQVQQSQMWGTLARNLHDMSGSGGAPTRTTGRAPSESPPASRPRSGASAPTSE